MIEQNPAKKLTKEAIAALVDFLECESLLETQIMLRNMLYLYIEAKGYNIIHFDSNVFAYLAYFMDQLGRNGIVQPEPKAEIKI